MTILETSYNPKHNNGIEMEGLRTGFIFDEKILRLAEVKVNKLHP